MITNLLANAGDTKILGLDPRVSEDPLKEGMATHSRGEFPRTGEPGEPQRVRT